MSITPQQNTTKHDSGHSSTRYVRLRFGYNTVMLRSNHKDKNKQTNKQTNKHHDDDDDDDDDEHDDEHDDQYDDAAD